MSMGAKPEPIRQKFTHPLPPGDPCIGGHSADGIQMDIESLQFLLHQQWKCSWPRKITFLTQDMKQVRQRRPHRVYAALTRVWASAH